MRAERTRLTALARYLSLTRIALYQGTLVTVHAVCQGLPRVWRR
jgi:hypothetical protein